MSLVRILSALALALALGASSCGSTESGDGAADSSSGVETDTTPSAPAAAAGTESGPFLAASEAAWTRLASWAGSGDEETERFRVTSDEWRLVVKMQKINEGGIGWILVRVMDPQRTELARMTMMDSGTDTSYVHLRPGVYYLVVGTNSVRWSVWAEEGRLPAERVSPSPAQ
jgi:hypothetical protein